MYKVSLQHQLGQSSIKSVPKNMGIQWRIGYRLYWISNVMPNFKSHNIIMSARVYAKKRVKDCKDVSVMSPQDEHWRQTSLLCLYSVHPYAVKT